MSDRTAIEWTEATWNPVTGCSKVSAGCDNCYAEAFAERFRGVANHPYEQGFDLRLWPARLQQPHRWKRPRKIFVNSMSDLFHEDVPSHFLAEILEVVEATPRHTYQVLTKRPGRMASLMNQLRPNPIPNLWLGTSIELDRYVWRADRVRDTRAAIRFLSLEPLLGPVPSLSLDGIDWVIVGGESGPGHRPLAAEWVLEIRDKCGAHGVPFFFKQWGGIRPKSGGRELEGEIWDEMPAPAGLVGV